MSRIMMLWWRKWIFIRSYKCFDTVALALAFAVAFAFLSFTFLLALSFMFAFFVFLNLILLTVCFYLIWKKPTVVLLVIIYNETNLIDSSRIVLFLLWQLGLQLGPVGSSSLGRTPSLTSLPTKVIMCASKV